eukprot:XP_011670863.1 PREDICTED: uncharacterized protein LOC105441451 [Strongylocentrotus purpuratus]
MARCGLQDGSSATGKFGALGGKLSTESHGFTLHIPPGALEEDREISLLVLTKIPNGLTLEEDELLASHGFQCYPSGLRFKKPATLIIPHCALVTAPNNKPIGQGWKDVHVLNDPDFQPVKVDDDEIVFRQGTLTVACQLGEKSPISDGHAIQYSDMSLKRKVTKYFKLDLTEESDETSVTLEVVETYGQTIIFNTRFQEIRKDTTEQNSPPSTSNEIPSDEQTVTDANILKVARLLPPDRWSPLYVALCIDYSTAEGIRKEFREITEQYIHLLQTWKAASTRTRKDLNEILIQVEAGGLLDKYVDYR